MVVPRLMAGRRRHASSSITRVTEISEGCKSPDTKTQRSPTLSKLSRGTLGVSSLSKTFGGSTGSAFGRLLSPNDEEAALKRPASERASSGQAWTTTCPEKIPAQLAAADSSDDDLGAPSPRREVPARRRQQFQRPDKLAPEKVETDLAMEECTSCSQCDYGSSEATTVPSSSYNSFDKEDDRPSPRLCHQGPPPLLGCVNTDIEDIEEEEMDDFDWGDIPRRTPSRVRFSTTQSFVGFTPYREIYGLHPSTFDFDHKGHMVREQKSGHCARGIEDVDEGDVLVCTSPCGVSFRTTPNLSDHVKGFNNVQEGEDVEVLECGRNWVRTEGGWLPLYIKGVCIFEMTGPKTVLDLGVPKTGAIASR